MAVSTGCCCSLAGYFKLYQLSHRKIVIPSFAYGCILIDEAQDLTPGQGVKIQFQSLLALNLHDSCTEKTTTCFVGLYI